MTKEVITGMRLKVWRAAYELEKKLGYSPSFPEIATHAGVSVASVSVAINGGAAMGKGLIELGKVSCNPKVRRSLHVLRVPPGRGQAGEVA